MERIGGFAADQTLTLSRLTCPVSIKASNPTMLSTSTLVSAPLKPRASVIAPMICSRIQPEERSKMRNKKSVANNQLSLAHYMRSTEHAR